MNENGNVRTLVHKLMELFPVGLDVVVVDDGSRDGTPETVQELADTHEQVHLLRREGKTGIGCAVRDGIAYALANLPSNYIATMDADWSHDPRELERLLVAAASADLVQGSRYVPKAQIVGWPWWRRLLSRVGNLSCRILLGTGLNEHTTYYRVYRRECAALVAETVHLNGYEWGVGSVLAALDARARVREVPITFVERREGNSKFGTRALLGWLLYLTRAFARRVTSGWTRVAAFAGVGATGLFVNEAVLWLLTGVLGLHYSSAAPVAIEASILWNFLHNDAYVFGRGRMRGKLRRLLRYQIVCVTTFAVVLSTLVLLVELAGIHYLIANFIGIFLAFVLNYSGSARWVWQAADSRGPLGVRSDPSRGGPPGEGNL